MKIPKYVQNLIVRRERLALQLMDVSSKLDDWLEIQGIPLGTEYCATGCMIYCEPQLARECVEENIQNFTK